METKDSLRTKRKRKAILAAGAILGIGALLILAAWNDTIWGDGIFGTGETNWNVQGGVQDADGTVQWDEFLIQGDAGRINFALDEFISPTGLTPGDEVRGVFGLREVEGDMGASVTIAKPETEVLIGENDALLGQLRVAIYDLGDGDTVPTWPSELGQPLAEYALNAGGEAGPVTIAAKGYRWLGFVVSLPITPDQFIPNQQVQAWWRMDAVAT